MATNSTSTKRITNSYNIFLTLLSCNIRELKNTFGIFRILVTKPYPTAYFWSANFGITILQPRNKLMQNLIIKVEDKSAFALIKTYNYDMSIF